jgi:lysophospholipase L1-like esterase
VDYVFINLGINDTIAFESDKAINSESPAILKRFDAMIASIRKFDMNIRIGIFITTPATSNVERFNEIYKGAYTHARYSRTNKLWIDALFKKYSGREMDNVFLIPVNLYIDPAEIIDVHPTPEGYRQMGAAVWNWLKLH